MIDIAASSLAMRAAKLAYDLWRENKGDSELPLSDKAKEVLTTMQTDPTENGVFLCNRGMADVGLPLVSPFAGITGPDNRTGDARARSKGSSLGRR